MTAYYNEIDPYAAQWLRNLISAGHIAPGDVDERSIIDVRADDVRGYTQCHWFAGIGGWSYALRLAGWPDDRPVWTGSCPCQPFSAAGKGQADEDSRHLAPTWLRLIRECRPAVVFGEQVGAAIRVGWLDALFTEMEQLHYACGAIDFPACSVGAPHIRQRLYFVAESSRAGTGRNAGAALAAQARCSSSRSADGMLGNHASIFDGATRELADADQTGPVLERSRELLDRERQTQRHDAHGCGEDDGLADARHKQSWRATGTGQEEGGRALCNATGRSDAGSVANSDIPSNHKRTSGGEQSLRDDGDAGGSGTVVHTASEQARIPGRAWEPGGTDSLVGDASAPGLSTRERNVLPGAHKHDQGRTVSQPGSSPWTDIEWLPCRDGKARPTQSAFQCMVDGVSYCVECLCPDEKKEVENAAKSSGFWGEVLRALREGNDATQVWQDIGRWIGFSKTTVLFAALCEQSRELGDIIFCEASRFSTTHGGSVREVRQDDALARPSYGPRYTQQCAEQFANALHRVPSWISPLDHFTGFPLANGFQNRLGLLRAYGNAIVPQAAAEFIGAYLDAAPDCTEKGST